MKIAFFSLVIILSAGFLFAQETDLPIDLPVNDGSARNTETFPYSLGLGAELAANTREKVAIGYSATFDRYLNNPIVAVGVKGTLYNDFNSITSTEIEVYPRLYFADLGYGAFFGQLGFGAAFYHEEDRQRVTYIMDFVLGYRFYIQKSFLRGFYVEPFVRSGYPFKWSAGLFAGHWLNF